jgi:FdhD protein
MRLITPEVDAASDGLAEITRRVEIARYARGEWTDVEDMVVREVLATIRLNGRTAAAVSATPEFLDELAVGHLYCEGVIGGPVDIDRIDLDLQAHGAVCIDVKSSSMLQSLPRLGAEAEPGREPRQEPELESDTRELAVDPERVDRLMAVMREHSDVFRRTGGTHSAALADESGLIVFREDIGRHNAIDKAAGYCLLSAVNAERAMLATSGRVFGKTVAKAVRLGVRVLVSPSAPTDRAVHMAAYRGLTLVGFARDGRFNVYAGAADCAASCSFLRRFFAEPSWIQHG